jgi:uncharacterized protein YfdQ (DUF2303 family)
MEDNLATLFTEAARRSDVAIIAPEPLSIASVPEGRTLQSVKKLLDEYRLRPERRTGIAELHDLDSFISWVNRHKDASTVLRCEMSRTAPKLHAIIDYHEEGPATQAEGQDDKARWGSFRATYSMPLDKRWLQWNEISGKPMGQGAFASFLEDHLLDLVGANNGATGSGELVSNLPAEVARFIALAGGKCAEPAEVVQLSKGLDLYADTKVQERINLQSGETSFTFEEKHRGAPDAVVVPQLFLVALPVFYLSDTLYRVPVRLRYRLAEGKLVWIPTLWQAEEVFDKAVRDAAKAAEDATERTLFYGAAL